MASQDRSLLLRLEGRIVGPWVVELAQTCESALAAGGPLRLHLADVDFMDSSGVALLGGLRARGVELVECPPFASAQLQEISQPHPRPRSDAAGRGPDA